MKLIKSALLFFLLVAAAAQAQLYYNILLYSPAEDSVYYLGERIDFRAEVTEAGQKISGAFVTAELPNNVVLSLSEKDGAYTGNYTLKWDEPVGKWNIKLKAERSGYKGERTISIQVKPAKLSVQILSPIDYAIRSEEVEIKVNVSYPDGSPFKGKVIATTPYREELLEYRDNLYHYKFPTKDGLWALKVNATDGKNSGYAEKIFLISRRSVLDSIAEFWYVLALPPLAIILVFLAVRFPDILLARLRKKEQKLRELIIGVQEKYFKEKTMDWKQFHDLQTKYKSQHENLKAEIAELEKKDRRLRGYFYRKLQELRKK